MASWRSCITRRPTIEQSPNAISVQSPPCPTSRVSIDDRILKHMQHMLDLHRPFIDDGESYCELDDECYPCKLVLLATIALGVGRVVELLEQQL